MPSKLQTIRETFFTTVFSLLGHVANCDGFINRNEIKRIETYMDKMDLSEKCRREAKHLFKAGARPQFNLHQALAEFSKTSTPNLIQILLVYLISMARTDGQLVQKEMHVVQQVAAELGYKSIVFDHLLKMIAAQDEFASPAEPQHSEKHKTTSQAKQKFEEYFAQEYGSSQGNSHSADANKNKQGADRDKEQAHHSKTHHSGGNKSSGKGYSFAANAEQDLDEAYQALGVNDSMSEKDIKKAYQRLVSQFHPDKLVGQGMPPDLVNAATERFKKIQAAYEYLKKRRPIDVVA